MANKFISQFTENTSAANDDLILIQDVSDTTDNAAGTYKKIQKSNLIPASGSGDVTGPASSTANHIPQFNDTTGKVLKDGLAVVTSFTSGTDTEVPTSAAVAARIGSAGGGDFSGPASSVSGNFVSFSGTTGKTGADSGSKASDFATASHNHDATYVPLTRTVNSKALSANITLTTADIADSTNKRYVTDANLTVIGNTSGTNTGDQTLPVKATGAEITTGTDDAKFATAKAIKDAGISADLTYVSPSSDHTGSGIKTSLTAGETTTLWQAAYIKSDGKAWLAKGDAATTMPACVLATGSISANAAGTYLVRGIARDDSWTWTVGGLLYVSAATGGSLTQTAPTGTGKQVQVVGVALSATTIMFMPNMMLLELA